MTNLVLTWEYIAKLSLTEKAVLVPDLAAVALWSHRSLERQQTLVTILQVEEKIQVMKVVSSRDRS